MKIIKTTENDYHMPIVVTKDEWKKILFDKELMKHTYIDALIAFYLENKHESICQNLGKKYNKFPKYLISALPIWLNKLKSILIDLKYKMEMATIYTSV